MNYSESGGDVVSVAAGAGIRGLPVPTPFGVGAINAFLIEGPPLTLVDTGPNSATVLRELKRLLSEFGRRVEDLELLVITHQHVDHLGLTGLVAEQADAEVACLGAAVSFVENYEPASADNDEYAHTLMLRHGVEHDVADALRVVASVVRHFGAPARVDRALADGDRLEIGGRELRVLHRPGHSPSDTLLHDAENRLLISGDHLLSRISSNALVSRPLDPAWDGTRPRPLLDYRRSMADLRTLDVDVVLGGHGPPIFDHRALIDRRVREQDERAEAIAATLRHGPMTAHELATSIWGRVAITQAFLTLSEILGHVDLLLESGVVVEDGTGDIVRFQLN